MKDKMIIISQWMRTKEIIGKDRGLERHLKIITIGIMTNIETENNLQMIRITIAIIISSEIHNLIEVDQDNSHHIHHTTAIMKDTIQMNHIFKGSHLHLNIKILTMVEVNPITIAEEDLEALVVLHLHIIIKVLHLAIIINLMISNMVMEEVIIITIIHKEVTTKCVGQCLLICHHRHNTIIEATIILHRLLEMIGMTQ